VLEVAPRLAANQIRRSRCQLDFVCRSTRPGWSSGRTERVRSPAV